MLAPASRFRLVPVMGLACVAVLGSQDAASIAAPPATSHAAAPVGEAPRYRFEPGQDLVYRLTRSEDLLDTEGESDPDDPLDISEWHVYVARQNDDGSWRLYIRRTFKECAHGDRRVLFESDFLGYCDLHPDGVYENNDSCGSSPYFELQPEEIFCQLPPDAAAAAAGWRYDAPASEASYDFTAARADDGAVLLNARITEPTDANYLMWRTRTVHFDAERGLITRIDNEGKADWHINPGHLRWAIALVDQRRHDAAWIEAFAREAEDYLAVNRQWRQAFAAASRARTQAACEAALQPLADALRQRLDAATLPEFQELYAARATRHESYRNGAVEEAGEREQLYAQDPVDWETTDFDGAAQRLVDYRGQVVLLDFWYRGCGHCIDALPKIKRLAAKYAGRPVAVLGVNNDRRDDDARYVIDTFELAYPTIRNRQTSKKDGVSGWARLATDAFEAILDRRISERYGVNGWPTFIVLDQTGRVALLVSGNSDSLEDDVSRAIDELLAHPPG